MGDNDPFLLVVPLTACCSSTAGKRFFVLPTLGSPYGGIPTEQSREFSLCFANRWHTPGQSSSPS